MPFRFSRNKEYSRGLIRYRRIVYAAFQDLELAPGLYVIHQELVNWRAANYHNSEIHNIK